MWDKVTRTQLLHLNVRAALGAVAERDLKRLGENNIGKESFLSLAG